MVIGSRTGCCGVVPVSLNLSGSGGGIVDLASSMYG